MGALNVAVLSLSRGCCHINRWPNDVFCAYVPWRRCRSSGAPLLYVEAAAAEGNHGRMSYHAPASSAPMGAEDVEYELDSGHKTYRLRFCVMPPGRWSVPAKRYWSAAPTFPSPQGEGAGGWG
jgi:hypothetical protein